MSNEINFPMEEVNAAGSDGHAGTQCTTVNTRPYDFVTWMRGRGGRWCEIAGYFYDTETGEQVPWRQIKAWFEDRELAKSAINK